MHRLMLGILCGAITGCDADCDDPGRLDGAYAMWSTVAAGGYEITGNIVDGEDVYPSESLFYNGWSEWDLKYSPGDKNFQLSLDGQPFSASYDQSADNCNAFTMSIEGTYTTDASTAHAFTWVGDLAYYGAHINGVYTYTDSWEDTLGNSGTTLINEGQLSATSTSNGDTGF